MSVRIPDGVGAITIACPVCGAAPGSTCVRAAPFATLGSAPVAMMGYHLGRHSALRRELERGRKKSRTYVSLV